MEFMLKEDWASMGGRLILTSLHGTTPLGLNFGRRSDQSSLLIQSNCM